VIYHDGGYDLYLAFGVVACVPLGTLGAQPAGAFGPPAGLTLLEAPVSEHLGNSGKWSQLELVAYENGLS